MLIDASEHRTTTDIAVDIESAPHAIKALVSAAQRGDMRAFERLYRLHSSKVFGLCLRMTRQRDVAEDCVQQTFIKAWRNLNRFEGRSAFSTWLHGIAVNVVLTVLRSRKPTLPLPQELDGDDFEINEDSAAVETTQYDTGDVVDMERALATLPPGARYVIVLQTIYGYSHEEVAQMLGIAVGTCKAQLHRGRRMLRERLNLPENNDASGMT